jgi:hypothetical protein
MNAIAQSANAVYQELNDGLNATKKRNEWGLANWPRHGVTNASPFAQWVNKQHNISIAFELVNDKNQVIGKQTLRMNPSFNLSANNDKIVCNFTENTFNTVAFNAVNANDITDNLTIRITTVNGKEPENAKFPITVLSGSKWQKYVSASKLNVKNGVVLGFSKSLSDRERMQISDLVIPTEFWDEKITSIGNHAFEGNQLTNITIPDGVTSIGDFAFSANKLSTVYIPQSVRFIGRDAFNNSSLKSITIGSNVTLNSSIVLGGNFFSDYYNKGRRAGTYQYYFGTWMDVKEIK